MPKLTITRGLPGSGKTTYAKRWVSEDAHHRSRVNRDDLRELLHGGAHGYDRPLEQAVSWAQEGAVRTLLTGGRDVICDDMNLANRNVRGWMKLADELGVEFEVVDFTNVAVEECVKRDLTRSREGGRYVGAVYIRDKHQRFIKGKSYPLPVPELASSPAQSVEPYVVPTPGVKRGATPPAKCVLVDIDGTMALMNGRGPFEWSRVGEDLPNQPVVDLVWTVLNHSGFQADHGGPETEVIFMSGRDEVCRPETTTWLKAQGFYSPKLFMRPEGDIRKDSIVKLELFNQHIRHDYNVQFVLDDRDQVVEMWRELGLTCLQVAPGNF